MKLLYVVIEMLLCNSLSSIVLILMAFFSFIFYNFQSGYKLSCFCCGGKNLTVTCFLSLSLIFHRPFTPSPHFSPLPSPLSSQFLPISPLNSPSPLPPFLFLVLRATVTRRNTPGCTWRTPLLQCKYFTHSLTDSLFSLS